MGRSYGQKLKILYLYDILREYTDAEHGITMPRIIELLEARGVTAERKGIYNDISLLRYEYDADIDYDNKEYRLLSREFELPEIKLLVDAVQSSKFITTKKSSQLIKKIEGLLSVHDADKLQGQVVVNGRIKSMNETIYYTVDAINEAISERKRIRFQYFEWTEKHEKKLKHGGELYEVSPLALLWDSDNYYLVGNDEKENEVRHYRVDKMQKIKKTDVRIKGFEDFDAAVYTKSVFGMFGGKPQTVTLRCENRLAGAVFDKFGNDVMTVPDGDHFSVSAKVAVSPQFFGWVCGLGGGVEIAYPEAVRKAFSEFIEDIAKAYK